MTFLDRLVADRLPLNRLPGNHGVGAVPKDAHLGQPGQQADSSAKKRIVIEVGHSETTLKKVSWGEVLRTSAADELLKVRQQVALLVATRADGVHDRPIEAVISSGGDQSQNASSDVAHGDGSFGNATPTVDQRQAVIGAAVGVATGPIAAVVPEKVVLGAVHVGGAEDGGAWEDVFYGRLSAGFGF